MPPNRAARAPQATPVVSASMACSGGTQTIRPIRRNTEGFVIARPARRVRQQRAGAEVETSSLLVAVVTLATISLPLHVSRSFARRGSASALYVMRLAQRAGQAFGTVAGAALLPWLILANLRDSDWCRGVL
jgi:hypothetical protein